MAMVVFVVGFQRLFRVEVLVANRVEKSEQSRLFMQARFRGRLWYQSSGGNLNQTLEDICWISLLIERELFNNRS